MAKGLRSNNKKALRHARRQALTLTHFVFPVHKQSYKSLGGGGGPSVQQLSLTGDCVLLYRDLVRLTEPHKAAEERRFAKVAETLARADADHVQVTDLLSVFLVLLMVQCLRRTAEVGVLTL